MPGEDRGRLDDDVWQLAQPFGNFIQREPTVGAPATDRTEFRVLIEFTHCLSR